MPILDELGMLIPKGIPDPQPWPSTIGELEILVNSWNIPEYTVMMSPKEHEFWFGPEQKWKQL